MRKIRNKSNCNFFSQNFIACLNKDTELKIKTNEESVSIINNVILTIRKYKRLPTIFITSVNQKSLPRFLGDKPAQDLLRPRNRIFHFDWDNSYTLTEKKSCWF